MRRLTHPARPGWRATVESQGLVFPMTALPGGGEAPYWYEEAHYTLTLEEVGYLERVTEELHGLCVEAAWAVLSEGRVTDLGLPPEAGPLFARSLAESSPSIYGRFDLAWDGTGEAKLLEYNADTPTGLIESSVVQWHWLDDVHPDRDQWNSLHERLVRAWQQVAGRLSSEVVHFAHFGGEETGEEWMTVAYLRDTAEQAGLTTVGLRMEDIGWHRRHRRFVDLDGEPLDTCFKLYPWEDMLTEPFGRHLLTDTATTWVEPAWKVLLGNKAILAVLWEMFPGHPNLLPAYLDGPHDLDEYVAKPLFGREGAGIRVVTRSGTHARPDGTAAAGWCYQAFHPLPSLDGNHVVLGAWVVDGRAAGLGIRESDGLVTDTYARFVPHLVEAPRPSAEIMRAWMEE